MAFAQNFDALVNMLGDFQVQLKLYKERVDQIAQGLSGVGSWAFEFALPQLRAMETLYQVVANDLGPDWHKILQYKRGTCRQTFVRHTSDIRDPCPPPKNKTKQKNSLIVVRYSFAFASNSFYKYGVYIHRLQMNEHAGEDAVSYSLFIPLSPSSLAL